MTRPITSLAVELYARSQPATPVLPPTPPLTQDEVEEFVRQYVAATNEADPLKLMGMVSREAEVSSVGLGKISRGWDAIRTATEKATTSGSRFRVTIGKVEVILVGYDAALAVAPIAINDDPGAATIIVKRTADGLRLIHEHYSLRSLTSRP